MGIQPDHAGSFLAGTPAPDGSFGMRIYFVRHGESEANRLRIISNRDLPHPLSETGRKQSRALAAWLRDKSIQGIYSSPVQRARETANILSAELQLTIKVEEALKEYDCGVLEGRGDAAAWAEHRYWVDSWREGRDLDRGPQGGESFSDIQKRFIPFIHRLVDEYKDTHAGLVLVGHGGTYLFGLPSVLSNVDLLIAFQRGMGNTCVVTAGLNKGILTCLSWIDIPWKR